MSVRIKILLGCLALTLVTILLGLFSRESEKELGRLGLRIYDEAFMAVSYMRSAQYEFAELSAKYRKRQAGGESRAVDEEMVEDLGALLEDLEVARDRAMSDQGRNAAQQLHERLKAFGAELDRHDPATVEAAIEQIANRFTALSERYATDGFKYRQRVEALAAASLRDTWIAIAGSVLIALVITALLTRAILPSIRRGVDVATAIAQGKLDNDIRPPGGPRGDAKSWGRSEPARLLQALAVMQGSIADNLARIEALRQADRDAQEERHRAQGQINDFIDLFGRGMSGVFRKVSAAAGEMAKAATDFEGLSGDIDDRATLVAREADRADANVRLVVESSLALVESIQAVVRQVQVAETMAGAAQEQAAEAIRRIERLPDASDLVAESGEASRRIAEIVRSMSDTIRDFHAVSQAVSQAVARQDAAAGGIRSIVGEVMESTAQVNDNATETRRLTAKGGGRATAVRVAAQALSDEAQALSIEVGELLEAIRDLDDADRFEMRPADAPARLTLPDTGEILEGRVTALSAAVLQFVVARSVLGKLKPGMPVTLVLDLGGMPLAARVAQVEGDTCHLQLPVSRDHLESMRDVVRRLSA